MLLRKLLPAAKLEKKGAVGEGQEISSIFLPLSYPLILLESCLFSELPCSNLCFNKTWPFGVFVFLRSRIDGTVLLRDSGEFGISNTPE